MGGFHTQFRIEVVSWEERETGSQDGTGTSVVSLMLYFLKKRNVANVNIC